MKPKFKTVEGSICAPQGFLASGVFCDIKRLGTGKGSDKGQKRDLALIVSAVPATVAGAFTTNQVCAAPVKVCLERVRSGRAQAVVAAEKVAETQNEQARAIHGARLSWRRTGSRSR